MSPTPPPIRLSARDARYSKEAKERRAFELFAPLIGWQVTAGSIQQPRPPQPDILCDVQGVGQIAVELVALDRPEPMTRARNMFETRRAWDSAMQARPSGEQDVLRKALADAYIHVAFVESAGPRDRATALYVLQTYLLSNTGRRGAVTAQEIGRPEGFRRAHIHRGTTKHGPEILASTSGYWSPPQVAPLIKHLKTHYPVACRLDLFAYSEHDDPDGSVSSLASIDAVVSENLPGTLFSAVHLFYVAHRVHIRSWHQQAS